MDDGAEGGEDGQIESGSCEGGASQENENDRWSSGRQLKEARAGIQAAVKVLEQVEILSLEFLLKIV